MASKYLQKYPVPQGFQEILHDFTREVLRDQPDDIIRYAAQYFECLNTGKHFDYQSKFNIPKGAGPTKTYQPQKAVDLAAQAKKVVDRSNLASVEQRVSSRPASNKLNVSHASSGQESYANEKAVTKQFMNDLYPKALHEVIDQDDEQLQGEEEEEELQQQEEQAQQTAENEDQLLNAEDFDHQQMKKVIKIQSHVRGKQARDNLKKK